MRWVTDLLVGGGSYRLHRNGWEAPRLVLLHGVARFQLVLANSFMCRDMVVVAELVLCSVKDTT